MFLPARPRRKFCASASSIFDLDPGGVEPEPVVPERRRPERPYTVVDQSETIPDAGHRTRSSHAQAIDPYGLSTGATEEVVLNLADLVEEEESTQELEAPMPG